VSAPPSRLPARGLLRLQNRCRCRPASVLLPPAAAPGCCSVRLAPPGAAQHPLLLQLLKPPCRPPAQPHPLRDGGAWWGAAPGPRSHVRLRHRHCQPRRLLLRPLALPPRQPRLCSPCSCAFRGRVRRCHCLHIACTSAFRGRVCRCRSPRTLCSRT
jgi:hypothetical protein